MSRTQRPSRRQNESVQATINHLTPSAIPRTSSGALALLGTSEILSASIHSSKNALHVPRSCITDNAQAAAKSVPTRAVPHRAAHQRSRLRSARRRMKRTRFTPNRCAPPTVTDSVPPSPNSNPNPNSKSTLTKYKSYLNPDI